MCRVCCLVVPAVWCPVTRGVRSRARSGGQGTRGSERPPTCGCSFQIPALHWALACQIVHNKHSVMSAESAVIVQGLAGLTTFLQAGAAAGLAVEAGPAAGESAGGESPDLACLGHWRWPL